MVLQLGDTAPNFKAQTTEGEIDFHDWIGDSWAILFSHPKDFTPVCTTELGRMAALQPEFEKRNVKVIGLSADSVDNHGAWSKDIEETQGHKPNYPMIGDESLEVSKLYGMIHPNVNAHTGNRTAVDNMTVRTVYVIDPKKHLRLMLTYPMATGRNFDEILRVIDSLQLTDKYKVATPANWQVGDDVIIAPSLSDEAAKDLFPNGWNAARPYLRMVRQPTN